MKYEHFDCYAVYPASGHYRSPDHEHFNNNFMH